MQGGLDVEIPHAPERVLRQLALLDELPAVAEIILVQPNARMNHGDKRNKDRRDRNC